MDPHKLTEWIHDEHDKVDELIHRLEKTIGAIPRSGTDRWLGELRDRYDHLRSHMHKHMALEERDGYLLSVVEKRPTLSGVVDRLKHEHHEMSHIMRSIHDELGKITPDDALLIKDCCARLARLLGYIGQHEQAENLIVMSVFTDDMGSKD